jgi:flagellar biosynthesis GTPase FlhF
MKANVFVHYKPIDHEEMNEQDHTHVKQTNHREVGGHEQSNHSEEEIQEKIKEIEENHEEEEESSQEEEPMEENTEETEGITEEESEEIEAEHDQEDTEEVGELDMEHLEDELAVRYARLVEAIQDNDYMTALDLLETDPRLINYTDENRWSVLHEAVRAGNTEIVDYLLSKGADVRAHVRGGGDALAIAQSSLPNNHEVVRKLRSYVASKAQKL